MGKSPGWKYAKNFDLRRAVGLKSDKPAPPEIPQHMVSSWTDTILSQTGKKPQRGFGGRLTFLGQDRESPVRVDGQLVVYAFEETEGQPRSTQPTRRYIFSREQFVRHESKSTLGPSYSVWLPWDDVGGERKNISLIARFEPHDGPLIVGEQTKHLLPGRTAIANSEAQPKAESTISDPSRIQLAQHTSAIANEAQPKSKMTSASIPLPSNWQPRAATLPVSPL